MGYYSVLTVRPSLNARIPLVDELNQAIEKLEYSNELKFDQNGHCSSDYESRRYYDDAELALLLSKYLMSGQIQLEYYGEDEQWGWRITPNKVEKLKAILIPEK